MTHQDWSRIKDIYFAVTALESDEDRKQALADACGGDAGLRRAVESLLANEHVPAGFLAEPALGAGLLVAPDTSLAGDAADQSGQLIGPYRLDRKLGSGGMGAVYVATRADGQFTQQVAVKLVKRGLDTDEILERFRLERQTLANLSHPNIAKLLDGGVAPDGRPYLVMEHVDGRAIDEYCEHHALTTSQRLDLFRSVCAAVHAAHQNLVVHRDLKPSNILVTESGVPKLVDFGIAKVLQPGADREAVTAAERRRLTPEYASPEQVRGEPVTTASDVYSLGIVLYELLSGRRPYRFKTATDAEIRQLVCDRDPPPPSAAAADSPGPEAPKTNSARRSRHLRGDLDTIVLRAMHKEPHRRYASAEQLADDIARYQAGLPVRARRDTAVYRVSKFVRRHRLGVGFTAALAAVLLGATAALAWQARTVRRERDRAVEARSQAEKINEFLRNMLSAPDPANRGRDVTVREVLEVALERARTDLSDQPAVLASVLGTIGNTYVSLGMYDRAGPLMREAVQIRRDHPGEPGDLARAINDLGTLLYWDAEYPEAEAQLTHALAIFREHYGPEHPEVAQTLNNLGTVLRRQRKYEEAERAMSEALAIRRKLFGATDPQIAESLNNLAIILANKEDHEGAKRAFAEALQIRRDAFGDDHPLTAQSIGNLAIQIAKMGDLREAEPLLLEVVNSERAHLGEDHPLVGQRLVDLGAIRQLLGDHAGAAEVLREAVRITTASLGLADPRTMSAHISLAESLQQLEQHAEAERLLLSVVQAASQPGSTSAEAKAWASDGLVKLYEAWGKPEKAAEYRAAAAPIPNR